MLMNVENLGFAGDSLDDPLNPSQLGESNVHVLTQNLIQEARKAGVITESNPRNKSNRKQPGLSVVPQPKWMLIILWIM
jgi:hypothetical protein